MMLTEMEDSERLSPRKRESVDLVTPKSTAEHGVLAMRSGTMSVTTVSAEGDDDVEEVQPTRRVLVAKKLTNSDASSGRIILPRVAVETNLSFVTAYKHYGLHVRDVFGQEYDFVVKSWANGTEHRRVFVLEQVGKFLKQHHVGVGDTVGICAVGMDEYVVEVNSVDVKNAAVNGRCAAPAAQQQSMQHAGSKSCGRGIVTKCTRSTYCSKGPGHPGFCSGPKPAYAGSSRSSGRSGHSHLYHNSGDDSSYGGEWHPVDQVHDTSSEDTTMHFENAVYMTEDMIHMEMQQLPDGLNRLLYVPARVKILKKLTAYDLSSRRIVLPADQASQGLVNASPEYDGSVYTLAAVDESHGWHFMTLRSWYSVTLRQGYYVEDANDLLKSRDAQAGDYFMVYRDSIQSPPKFVILDGTSCKVKKPVNGPDAEVYFSDLPLLLLPPGENGDMKTATDSLRTIKKWHKGCFAGMKRKAEMPDYAAGFALESFEDRSDTAMHQKSKIIRSSDPLVSLLHLLE